MRDGAAYLAGLRDQRRIWHNGALVDDVTTAPGFANAANTIAAYYDFQCDPAVRDVISYVDEDGERSHLSFKVPRSKQDLRNRGAAFAAWAEHTGGQLGRAPDYMNAAMVGVAAAKHHWGQKDPVLGEHAVGILDRYRRNDVCLTHTFITPQIDRKTPLGQQEPFLNAGVVKRTSDGVIVRGARILGTLAPFADENVSFVLPIVKGDDELKYALGFTIPVDAPGLHWVCRDSFDPNRSTHDYPISSRFEEIDTVAVFDDVEVPWEYVFDYGDEQIHNFALPAMRFQESLGHHVITKNVAKTRFLLGLAHLIAENAQTNSFINVQIRLGEIVTMLQTLESIAIAAVEGAVESPDNGVWYCNANAITAGLRLFPEYYVQIIDHIKQIGGSNFMAAPSEANMEALTEVLGPSVERYFTGAADMKEDGIDKVPLFRLAWDVVGTSFAGRQELYERFFFGDQQVSKSQSYIRYDKTEAIEMVRRLLDPSWLKQE
jgi:4-hydroxyphenylacetate 3-monooxygenase